MKSIKFKIWKCFFDKATQCLRKAAINYSDEKMFKRNWNLYIAFSRLANLVG